MAIRQTTFEAIGTHWDIKVSGTISTAHWRRALTQLHARIELFDKTYSRFRKDSWVTHISTRPGRYELPPDGYELLAFYERLYHASGGTVTPLVGQTMVEAGYDAAYSLQPQELHSPVAWEDALNYTKTTIAIKRPVLLDFGAAGKGYLVDIVARLLRDTGLQDFIINAGGDIVHRSQQDDTADIGLENPLDTSEVIGLVHLHNQSLCASAGSKRTWGEYHHIINPFTLASPTDILATWVMADDTLTADGIATALFMTEPDALLQRFEFSYAILQADMSLTRSPDFPVTVFENTHAKD